MSQYQQVSGLTTTNSVPVRGYAGTFTIPDYGIVAEISIAGVGAVSCISQGKILYGLQTAGTGERVVGTATPQANAYLLETAYTQAMRDAGNIFATGGTTYKIIGLIMATPT